MKIRLLEGHEPFSSLRLKRNLVDTFVLPIYTLFA
jgi:hypothetical protein